MAPFESFTCRALRFYSHRANSEVARFGGSVRCSVTARLEWVRAISGLASLFAIFAFLAIGADVLAEEQRPTTVDAPGMVKLNFPNEIELKAFVDYVSQRLSVKILYDEQIANKKISIKAPGEIPTSSLLDLLQSALRIKGLALIDAEAPGWKRIVPSAKLAEIAQAAGSEQTAGDFGAGIPVTQAFALKFADSQAVDQAIKPFLSQPGASSISLKEQKLLIVTDYANNLARVSQWIDLIDQPKARIVMRFIPMHNVEASALAQQINSLLTAKAKVQGTNGAGLNAEVSHDARTNQLLVIGASDQISEVEELVRSLDVPLGVKTVVHPFRYVSAERIDRLVKETIDPLKAKTHYHSAIEKEDNQLIVTAPAEVHDQIARLKQSMDISSAHSESPMRLYPLRNINVLDLLETLRGMEGETPGRPQGHAHAAASAAAPPESGGNRPPAAPGQPPPTPPIFHDTREGSGAGGNAGPTDAATTVPKAPVSFQASNAKITADPATNTLIVIAEPSVQQMYAELIQALDRRRPQVMIEAKVVVLDTSNDFSLGVELSHSGQSGAASLLGFSSFGLSKVDPTTGALSALAGNGLNGMLLDSHSIDLVMRALADSKRSRVLSAPRILVNDNTTGILSSVAEVPYTSVNASQTVATTAFAGFAKAGTTISVTPHISEGDHLQLEFKVTLNSFTGSGNNGVPPPRQTNEVESKVIVPDGHTIIVGGLNQKTNSTTTSGVPYLQDIPILGHFFGMQSRSNDCSSLFVFIRPLVLREDKFNDLKFLSSRDGHQAGVGDGLPSSQPVLLR